MPEFSPKGDHSSNPAEGEIRLLEGLTRTLLIVVEKNYKTLVTADSRILPWAGRHAGWLRTRYVVGPDGKTPIMRLRGAPYRGIVVDFAECVWFKYLSKDKAKLESRWDTGIFLGRRDLTDEAILGTRNGVEQARTIRRKPEERRWDKEEYVNFIGVPWNPRGTSA